MTPKSAILAWMEAALARFEDAHDLVEWMSESPTERHFFAKMKAIQKGAASEAKAAGRDQNKAMEDAAIEAAFLHGLWLGANFRVLEDLVNQGLMVSYCARVLQLLLYRDAVSRDLNPVYDYLDDIVFAREQAGESADVEQDLLDRLSTYLVDQLETEGGMEYVNNRTMNRLVATESGPLLPAPPSQLQEVRQKLSTHLVGLYLDRAAIVTIAKNYFGGREILFPRGRQRLEAAVDMAEGLVEEFNGFVQARLDRFDDDELLHTEKPGADPLYPRGFFIDVRELSTAAESGIREQVAAVVLAAKADALAVMGRDREASEIKMDLASRMMGRKQ